MIYTCECAGDWNAGLSRHERRGGKHALLRVIEQR